MADNPATRIPVSVTSVNTLLQDGSNPLTANWDAGAFDIRAQKLTADALTAGRVIYTGTEGLLSVDSDLRWDNINKWLGIGMEPTLPIESSGMMRIIGTNKSMGDGAGRITGDGLEFFYQIGVIGTSVQTIGAGLDDLTGSGRFWGPTEHVYQFTISTAAGTDKFTWSVDGGGESGEIEMTGATQTIEHGLDITWGATTGHDLGDKWTITCVAPVGYVQAEWRHPTTQSEDTRLPLDLNCGTLIIDGNRQTMMTSPLGAQLNLRYSNLVYTTFEVDATNNLIITGAGYGNVGLGCTPAYKLDVYGAGFRIQSLGAVAAVAYFKRTTSATAADVGITDYYNAATRIGQLGCAADGAADNGKFDFWVATGGSLTRRMSIKHDGSVGIGTASPGAKCHIDQSSTTGAIPVLTLDQADVSDGFINLVGTSAASATGPISTWHAGGAEIEGYYRIEINGAQKWAPYCADPTS